MTIKLVDVKPGEYMRLPHTFLNNADVLESTALEDFETRNIAGAVIWVKATSEAGTPNYTLSVETSPDAENENFIDVDAISRPDLGAINDENAHVYALNLVNCHKHARFKITLNGGDGGDDKFLLNVVFLYGSFTGANDVTIEAGDINIGAVTANAGTNLNTSALNLEATQQAILDSLAADAKDYDTTAITYVSGGAADGEIETVTYLNGVTPVYTLTLGYNAVSGKLESVIRS